MRSRPFASDVLKSSMYGRMTAHSAGVKVTVTDLLLGVGAIMGVQEESGQCSVVLTCLFSVFFFTKCDALSG